jgi:hypothetical protein
MSRYINNNINGGYLFELFKEPMLVLLIAAAIIILFWTKQRSLFYASCHCSCFWNLFIRTTAAEKQ